MAYTKSLSCAFVLIVVGSAWARAAEPVDKPKEDPKLTARLKLFRQLAEKVQVSLNTGDRPQAIKMLPESLYRYSQESRDFPDAVVWGWGDGGRPKALLTLACQIKPNSRELVYEFDSLSAKSLVCAVDGQVRWSPNSPGLEMRKFEGAPAPADDHAGRLRQIDALLGRLKANELDEQAGQMKPFDLAWAAKPVYCYNDPDQGIVDGAICFSCIETNPEIVLVLEAQRHANSQPAWYCGFNRLGWAELHVTFDDNEIWTAPHIRGTSPSGSYYMMSVRLGQ